MADVTFSKLSDDVVLKIFFTLKDDPRNWGRLSCVCRKFSSLISAVCCKSSCLLFFPFISDDLSVLSSSAFPNGWSSLHKLAVSCPGLLHSGVLLDNSDFGLRRELGDHDDFRLVPPPSPDETLIPSSSAGTVNVAETAESFGEWSLYDDLYFDTVYNTDEWTQDDDSALVPSPVDMATSTCTRAEQVNNNNNNNNNNSIPHYNNNIFDTEFVAVNETSSKKRKVSPMRPPHNNIMQLSHLASGTRSLNREQGNKLLASRFRGDSLYLSDWPGCVHALDKRKYMVFRGFFDNFKRSKVWRAINDANKNKIDIKCAFCYCNQTWDLHSSFCLKRGFGFHDDGEPVVRAYVCENGHVSGAWTDLPIYS